MYFKKDEVIKYYEVVDNYVKCNIQIGDSIVMNPTLEVFRAQGWEEYILPMPEEEQLTEEELYKRLVVEKIRMVYPTIDDEIAILRQKNTKPDEFDEYFRYVEQCKEEAKQELNLN